MLSGFIYNALRSACRVAAVAALRVRCRGRDCLPATGGALLLCNHQSHLDPILVGLACDRRLSYLARQTLFGSAPFRWLIELLGAIPVDREGAGIAGLKETLRRLRRQEVVLIFPEGTRTSTGQMSPLKPGFCALAKRAGVPLVPVGLDGAFQTWPRWRPLPWPSVVHVQLGPPIQPDQIASFTDDELVAEVEQRIAACRQAARSSRRRALGQRACPVLAAEPEAVATDRKTSPVPQSLGTASTHCGGVGSIEVEG